MVPSLPATVAGPSVEVGTDVSEMEGCLLLCDEPTGNLDSDSTKQLLATLSELHGDGLTVLVVSHDPQVCAEARSHRRRGHSRPAPRRRPQRSRDLRAAFAPRGLRPRPGPARIRQLGLHRCHQHHRTGQPSHTNEPGMGRALRRIPPPHQLTRGACRPSHRSTPRPCNRPPKKHRNVTSSPRRHQTAIWRPCHDSTHRTQAFRGPN